MNFDPVKVAFWTKHLQDWAVSGLSLIEYCRHQAIAYSTFYTWRKRLASVTAKPVVTLTDKKTQPSVAGEMKPVSAFAMVNVAAKNTPKPLLLVPVSMGVTAKPPEIVLRSPAGWQATLSDQMDLSDLAQLLRQMP
jgi:putative transposase